MKIQKSILSYIVTALLIAGCSASGPAAVPAKDVQNTMPPSVALTETPAPRETPVPTEEPTLTITPTELPSLTPTKFVSRVEGELDDLLKNKYITSTDGKLVMLDDFEESWAQLYWYQWWTIAEKPTNFVVSSDVEWESASKTANWADSGCGFVFHTNGQSDHYATFIAMDGYVRTYRSLKGNFDLMKGGYAQRFKTPADKAKMTLVVDKQWITVLVNGKKIVRFEDKYLNGGEFGWTLISGTNKDFGTRCKFTNTELWVLK